MSEQPFPGVIGFLSPAMEGKDNNGRTIHAYRNPDDVHRIETGYACGNCAAVFETFRLECPICLSPTHVSATRQETPALWQQSEDERNYGSGKTATRSSTDFIKDVQGDRAVEQAKLSALRKRKR